MQTPSGIIQVGKFGIVGVLNTVIDFTIFNFLTGRLVRMPKITANICSTSVAMVFSFFANRQTVFTAGSANPVAQAILFFAFTAIGLWGLQSGILYLLLHRWEWPKQVVVRLLQMTGLKKHLSTEFVLKNGAKLCAVVFSLIWNFFAYKYVVFR